MIMLFCSNLSTYLSLSLPHCLCLCVCVCVYFLRARSGMNLKNKALQLFYPADSRAEKLPFSMATEAEVDLESIENINTTQNL